MTEILRYSNLGSIMFSRKIPVRLNTILSIAGVLGIIAFWLFSGVE